MAGARTAQQAAAGWLLIAAIATLTQPVGYRGFDQIELAGLQLSTYQNLLILLAAGFAAMTFGVRRWLNPVLGALVLILGMSFAVGARLPELAAFQSSRTFAALALAPFLFEVRFPSWLQTALRRLMPWLALANLALALSIYFILGHEPYRIQFGAFRLEGTLVAAGLAKLALGALLMSLLAARRRPRWLWLVAVNFGVIVWTGTRMSILSAVLLCCGWIVSEIVLPSARSRIRERIALGVLIPLVLLSYGPFFATRFSAFWPDEQGETFLVRLPGTAASTEEGGEDENGVRISLTGRIAAWRYYYGLVQDDLWFGRGLGAGVVGSSGHLHSTFRLPHSEYLRFLVDGGLVGLTLILLAHLWMLAELMRRHHAPSVRLLVLVAFGILALEASVSNAFAAQQFIIPFWLYLAFLTREDESAR